MAFAALIDAYPVCRISHGLLPSSSESIPSVHEIATFYPVYMAGHSDDYQIVQHYNLAGGVPGFISPIGNVRLNVCFTNFPPTV